MSVITSIPLQVGTPQTFSIALNGITYQLTFKYRNDPAGGWFMDIADSGGNAIVSGIPLVTGANLLEQYDYLAIGGGGGRLWVQGPAEDPDEVPTFANLGGDAQLYWVTG